MPTRRQFLALAAATVAFGGCRPQRGAMVPGPRFPLTTSLSLWIDRGGNEALLGDAPARRALFGRLRQIGFRGLFFEANAPGGARLFGGVAAELNSHFADAAAAGLLPAIAWAPLAAAPDDPEDWLQREATRRGAAGYEAMPVRRSASRPYGLLQPLKESVRERMFAELAQLDALRPAAILLVDFGFASERADLSESARRAFELWLRRTVDPWPSAVLAAPDDAEAAPYETAFRMWRADAMRELLSALRDSQTARAAELRAPVFVLGDAPYPLHRVRGLNWASQRAPLETLRGLPQNYERTGAAHRMDAFVAGLWSGYRTSGEAVAAGMEPWAASDVLLPRAGTALAGDAELWAAAPIPPGATALDCLALWKDLLGRTRGTIVLSLGELRRVGLESFTNP